MFNPVTDRLKLVEKVVVNGRLTLGTMPLPLFDQAIPVINGFSQEVFRGDDYIGSVRPTNSQVEEGDNLEGIHPIKVRRGDIIYLVTLAPQPYHFAGTVQSKDKYQRIYEMSIVLLIKDSKRLIEWYRESKDPAGWVIGHFKGNFERWASTIEYDKLNSARPSYDNIAQLLSNQCGIRIAQPKWSFRADTIREREWEIRHSAKLRKIEIENEHELKMLEEQLRREREGAQKAFEREEKLRQNTFEREEKLRQNEFIRTEKLKYRQNEALIQLLSETVKELVMVNRERLREALDYNGSVKDVLQDSLKFLSVFSGPVPENEEIIDSMSLNGNVRLEGEEDVNDQEKEKETVIDLPAFSGSEMDEGMGQSPKSLL